MPKPSVAEFWELLVRSRLLDAAAATAARAEFDAAAPSDVDTRTVAAWLVRKGLLTRWQAKRLAAGNLGPFFLGDYRLLERHDRPGDALVFTARHEPSARIVTLVLLSASRCQAVDVWTEIVRRTTAAYQTGDPMLSRTWALEQGQGARFIVAEQVTGETLAQELARLGPMPAPQVGVLGVQLATAVAAIHAQGVLHGGVSLETLVREPNPATPTPRTGRVRLLQFPQAIDPHLVPLRARVATPEEIVSLGENACFVAPELVMPDTTCDERSDVYTIGGVLYALLSGVPPCWCGSPGATLQRAAFVGPEPLAPPVPPEVVTLIGRLMARDPAARVPTAAEAATAIAACFGMAAPAPVVATSKPLPSALATTVAATPPPTAAAAPPPAVDGLPRIDVQAGPRSATAGAKAIRVARRRSRTPLIAGLMAVATVAAAIAVFLLARPTADENEPVAEEVATAPATEETPAGVEPADAGADAAAAEPPGRFVVVEGDQTLPWAPPTGGQPPTLAYLAPGSQLMLLVRPAAALAGEEGRRIVTALGPQTQAAVDQVATLCGCDLVDMESITAGWQSGAAGDPVVAFAVRFVPPRTGPGGPAERKVAWGDTTAEEVGQETVHRQSGDGLGFWLPRAERGGVLVVGPPDLLLGMAREAGAESRADAGPLVAQLPQDLETLVAMLDGERHATLVASTGYLLGGAGRALLSGSLDKLAGPLADFCGDDVSALAVSVQAGDDFYAELDAVGRADAKPPAVAARLAAAVEALPDAIEEYCSALDVAPYGRKIVLRLPSMVRALAATLRLGAEGKGVVLNAYLPPTAGHNLALAAELALAQEPGVVAVAAPRTTPAASGALAKLQTKMTLVFAKDTLERSIQLIADEVGVPMEIVGTDLQLEGITKNQSFGLDERDATAEAILRTILAKANPDGKLVFVIRTTDGVESIDITTRSAAEKRGDVLPPGF